MTLQMADSTPPHLHSPPHSLDTQRAKDSEWRSGQWKPLKPRSVGRLPSTGLRFYEQTGGRSQLLLLLQVHPPAPPPAVRGIESELAGLGPEGCWRLVAPGGQQSAAEGRIAAADPPPLHKVRELC